MVEPFIPDCTLDGPVVDSGAHATPAATRGDWRRRTAPRLAALIDTAAAVAHRRLTGQLQDGRRDAVVGGGDGR